MDTEIHFLNVDLEIESSENLQLLVDDLGEDVLVLFNGKWKNGFNFLAIETYPDANVDEKISLFCTLIENLSPEAKLIWDNAYSKKFDAGFECGEFPNSYQTEIRADTIKRVAELGASIVVTIYPRRD